jgi:hypothetical protein
VGTLVIRSARETVLDAYLTRCRPAAPVTVLGHPSPWVHSDITLLPAPPGPLRWKGFDRALRTTLKTGAWSEIVILHNQADRSYVGIHAIVARIGCRTPFRIFFADGSQQAYGSWLSFLSRRAPMAAAACPLLALLVIGLLPLWLAAIVARRAIER